MVENMNEVEWVKSERLERKQNKQEYGQGPDGRILERSEIGDV